MSTARSALRSLRASAGSNVLVVVTLAVGIGANSAIFAVADALLLRTLPVRDPEGLVTLHRTANGDRPFYATAPLWELIREEEWLEGAAAWSRTAFDLAASGERKLLDGMLVSHDFFDVVGATPVLGRWFDEGETLAAVLGYGFWQSRLGGRADAVGETVTLDRTTFIVVGIAPEGFHGLEVGTRFDVAIPLEASPLVGRRVDRLRSREARWLRIALRLAPNDAPEAATARLRAKQPSWRERTLPDFRVQRMKEQYMQEPLHAVSASRGASIAQSRFRAPVVTLQAATGLILLIACGNVAAVLLARVPSRRRELGIRAALGASSARLFRQLLAETSLLCAIALPFGAVLSVLVSRVLTARASTAIFLDVALNGRALAFTGALGLVTMVLVGSLPAWRASREDPLAAFRPRSSSGVPTVQVGRVLAPAQVALSLVLLTTASLFLRSWIALENVPLGFSPTDAWIVEVDASRSPRRDNLSRLHEMVKDAAQRTPGVDIATTSALVPIGGMFQITIVDLPHDPTVPEAARTVQKNLVSPGWFRAVGTPLLAGRSFTSSDRAGSTPVAIVNEAFAERLLPRGSAVGAEIREAWAPDENSPGLRVIGVARDTRFVSVKEPAEPAIYRPVAQVHERDRARPIVYVIARVAGSADPSRALVRAIESVDPELSISIQRWEDRIRATYWRETATAELAAAFGGLGVFLSLLGLAGVVGHRVARRRRELAVRLALGAEHRSLARAVLRGAIALIATGVAAGLLAATFISRLVESMLFEVPPFDPVSLAGAAALMLATSLAASWIPARRVLRLDPATVLRQE